MVTNFIDKIPKELIDELIRSQVNILQDYNLSLSQITAVQSAVITNILVRYIVGIKAENIKYFMGYFKGMTHSISEYWDIDKNKGLSSYLEVAWNSTYEEMVKNKKTKSVKKKNIKKSKPGKRKWKI